MTKKELAKLKADLLGLVLEAARRSSQTMFATDFPDQLRRMIAELEGREDSE